MNRELELGKGATSDGKTPVLHLLNTLLCDTPPLKMAIKGSTDGG